MKRKVTDTGNKPRKYITAKKKKTHNNKVKNVLNVVPKIKQEIKVVDNFNSTNVIDFQPNTNWFCLNACQVGTTMFTRVGRKIAIKSIRVRGYIWPDVTVASDSLPDNIRINVIYDRQSNGAVPVYGDVFQDYLTTGGTSINDCSNPNPTNFERFVVLYDQTKTYNNTSNTVVNTEASRNTTNTSQPLFFDVYLPLKGLETIYKTVGGTYSDISTGTLWLKFTARGGWNQDNRANYSMKATWTSRMRYYDN